MILRNTSLIQGATAQTLDGPAGHIEDVYFDDRTWRVRYLVLDTGSWLSGRRVLIAPAGVREVDWEQRAVHLDLTRSRLETSPGIDDIRSVSRQHEAEQASHFGWPLEVENGNLLSAWAYTGNPLLASASGTSIERTPVPETSELPSQADSAPQRTVNPHLRSLKEVSGYAIQASDGAIGHAEGFLLDPQEWLLQYLLADTRNWLPGRRVMVAHQWLRTVDWNEKKMLVDRTRDQIRNGPRWDPGTPVSLEYRILPPD